MLPRLIGVSLAVSALVIGLSGCSAEDDRSAPRPETNRPRATRPGTPEAHPARPEAPRSSPTPQPPSAAPCRGPVCEDVVVRRFVEVYTYTAVDGDYRVTPERVRVVGSAAGERPAQRVRTAVQALLDHEPARGHRSLWSDHLCAPASRVRRVTVTDGLVTVDLAPPRLGALCDLSIGGGRVLEQQVAWTVTVAAGVDVPVLVTSGRRGLRVLPGVVVRADPYALALGPPRR